MTKLTRVSIVVSGALCLTGCDGGPTAPSTSEPPTYSLRPGAYTLTVVADPASPTNPCPEASTEADRVSLPVMVEADGAEWNMRADVPLSAGSFLSARLRTAGKNVVTGAVEAQVRDAATGVTVSIVPPDLPAGFPDLGPQLVGSLQRADLASGIVSVPVRFFLGGGMRVCAVNRWRLEAR